MRGLKDNDDTREQAVGETELPIKTRAPFFPDTLQDYSSQQLLQIAVVM